MIQKFRKHQKEFQGLTRISRNFSTLNHLKKKVDGPIQKTRLFQTKFWNFIVLSQAHWPLQRLVETPWILLGSHLLQFKMAVNTTFFQRIRLWKYVKILINKNISLKVIKLTLKIRCIKQILMRIGMTFKKKYKIRKVYGKRVRRQRWPIVDWLIMLASVLPHPKILKQNSHLKTKKTETKTVTLVSISSLKTYEFLAPKKWSNKN